MSETLISPHTISYGELPYDTEITDSHEKLPQTESARNATRALDKLESRPLSFEDPYPKETVIGDGEHVEGQQLSFIKTDTGAQLTFKLTSSAYDKLASSQDTPPSSGTRYISYVAKNGHYGIDHEIMTTTADMFHANGLDVLIARRNSNWRALDGVVSINLPEQDTTTDAPISNDELGRRADAVMRNLLNIEDAFISPDHMSEVKYKVARYAWHHKIEDGTGANIPVDKLVRQEVFPGYSTIVEPGKYEEYERRHGEYALTHYVSSDRMLPKILKNGLMATHERFRRGVKAIGMSSEADLSTGGADSVFVRTVTEQSLRGGSSDDSTYDNTIIILKPELMDRTDWYTYAQDQYGTTDPSVFDARLSPESLLAQLNRRGWRQMTANEQMFRTGIPIEAMAGVSVGSPEHREDLIKSLYESGITEVNGAPVEDFIKVAERLSQIIDIAHGRPPRKYEPPRQPEFSNYTSTDDWQEDISWDF